jgi:hypothetical protein
MAGFRRRTICEIEAIRESRIASFSAFVSISGNGPHRSCEAAVAVDRGRSKDPDHVVSFARDRDVSLSINLLRVMQAMRWQGQDARECSGADGDH